MPGVCGKHGPPARLAGKQIADPHALPATQFVCECRAPKNRRGLHPLRAECPTPDAVVYLSLTRQAIADRAHIESPRPFKAFKFFLALRPGFRRDSARGSGGVFAFSAVSARTGTQLAARFRP